MNNLKGLQELYCHFFIRHQDSIDAVSKILSPSPILQEHALPLIGKIVQLWDDFDADAKDLIVGALKRLSRKVDLSSIPATELQTQVFTNNNRRRLLRDAEIRALFPQLASLSPVGYDATWLHLPKRSDNPSVVNWLKQHDLIANPFSSNDIKNYPFYPEGFARPDQWEDFLETFPQHAQCPSLEDARALAFLLRVECLPVRKKDAQGQETVSSGGQILPVWVSLEQTAPSESPFVTLARSTARTWMDILPFSPDAMLDLLPAEQEAILEMLCWAFGSNGTVVNLLKRIEANLEDENNRPGSVMLRKIREFKSKISSMYLPQDSILISWLKIRPPDLNCTYLILHLDEYPVIAPAWWLEQFSVLVPTLFLNGMVTKAFSSSHTPVALPLSTIQLNWSNSRLKTSVNSQFDSAMDPDEKKAGKSIRFHELFGPGVTEEQTTAKLISSSRNSLARMCSLGNRLLQYHCEHSVKDGIPEKYLYVEDLETILNIA
jgi:hypothetical protein